MRSFIRRLLNACGPGVITGAADDDPSGIATYSQAGAQFGMSMLWLSLITTPLMSAVQEMCARIGMVTGKGLVRNLREHGRSWVVYFVVSLVVIANTINIGADLGMVAATAHLIIPLPTPVLLVGFTLLTLALVVLLQYKAYARYLKWLTLSLLAYVAVAFVVRVDWLAAFRATLLPNIILTKEYLLIVIAFLGTTISPYLFFWQANEEVEEGKWTRLVAKKAGASIHKMRSDVILGMSYSNIISWFIVLTTASVLFSNGIFNIDSPARAAEVLRPIAGAYASWLFAIGVIGVGLLGVPVLAGAVGYAVSELFEWREGLNYAWKKARAFYSVIIIATLVGLVMNIIGINPVRALIYTAVINGVVAAPLIFIIIRLANNKRVMGKWINGRLSNFLCGFTFFVMALASIAWIATYLK